MIAAELKPAPTLVACLEEAARDDRFAISFFRRGNALEQLGYAELFARARSAASFLRENGVGPQGRVALVLGTCSDLVAAYFGVLMSGAMPFLLATPRLGRSPDYARSIGAQLQAAGAGLVLTDRASARHLESAVLAAHCRLAFVDDMPTDGPEAGLAQPEPGDVALIQFSSGTTNDPRPIALSHANIIANCRAIIETFPGDLDEHGGCSWLPLHHDMGLIGGLLTAVVAGRSTCLMRPEDFITRPASWLRLIQTSGATISPAPNFALQICADRIKDSELEDLRLDRWQIALIGAETVHEQTLRLFADRFAAYGFSYGSFTPVYGLAEATLAVSFTPVGRGPLAMRLDRALLAEGRAVENADGVSLVSVGRPLAGIEIEIRDQDGKELGERQVGRIFVQAPSVMLGYLDQPDQTKRVVGSDGWLDTGDLGFLLEGELFIYGRARDLIILNGRNHDPVQIERSLDGVAGLNHDRAAAFAIEEPDRGTEGFVLLVERERGAETAPEALATAAREAVIQETGLVPSLVGVLETARLPRTTSGKIRRGAARTQHLSNQYDYLAISRR
ncbi:MAG: fatty acyl-AMP ligase [Spirochaetales bacterium]|nr:fatty acyl-AMP ligase [Leptospiraceae bacterium]MCP5480965.1 fatty acyl-AMP ligase [Spirochaetales bacterium]MCP5485345.1 fatty acyl-AMP ligase [Spirochaetales bacterium]